MPLTPSASSLGKRQVAAKWVRNPSDLQAIEAGCFFDKAAGQFVIDFIESFCRQSKGRWAGQKLMLLSWEKDLIYRLFGWKLPSGLRRFKSLYLEVPKKNGKSTLLSALSLVLLLLDAEGGPEIHIFAFDKDQASIVFDSAKRMVQASPSIAGRLQVIDSRKTMLSQENGTLRANASDVPGADGINPSAIIWDELHRQKNRQLWEVLEYAGTSRDQYLRAVITTAGESESGPWWEQRMYSMRVNLGLVSDIHHLGVIYSADPRTRGGTDSDLDGLDLNNPEVWKQANPSMGATMSLDGFARDWNKAKETPTELSNFKRLRLGIVARTFGQFVALSEWDACAGALDGSGPSYLGLDLSSREDLTALVILSGSGGGGYDVELKVWLPQNRILDLERSHKVNYREWERRGLITLTPGNAVDYAFVKREIIEICKIRDVKLILSDEWNSHKLASELDSQEGLPVKLIRQGYVTLNEPTKELRRLIVEKELRHGGNPILRWMISNCVVETDAQNNIKLNKKLSTGKIDGVSALVNALRGAIDDPDNLTGPSVYEQGGLIWL